MSKQQLSSNRHDFYAAIAHLGVDPELHQFSLVGNNNIFWENTHSYAAGFNPFSGYTSMFTALQYNTDGLDINGYKTIRFPNHLLSSSIITTELTYECLNDYTIHEQYTFNKRVALSYSGKPVEQLLREVIDLLYKIQSFEISRATSHTFYSFFDRILLMTQIAIFNRTNNYNLSLSYTPPKTTSKPINVQQILNTCGIQNQLAITAGPQPSITST